LVGNACDDLKAHSASEFAVAKSGGHVLHCLASSLVAGVWQAVKQASDQISSFGDLKNSI